MGKAQEDKHVRKRRKTANRDITTKGILKSVKIKSERCKNCKQYMDRLLFYKGHPNNSNEEFIALTDEKLSSFVGDSDMRPTHKVEFS